MLAYSLLLTLFARQSELTLISVLNSFTYSITSNVTEGDTTISALVKLL